jgi:hypothetical protein
MNKEKRSQQDYKLKKKKKKPSSLILPSLAEKIGCMATGYDPANLSLSDSRRQPS